VRIFVSTLIVAFTLTFAPAYATNYPLTVANHTNRYAWVTVWYAYAIHGWRLEREMCMKPFDVWKGSINYNTPELGPELKVRAEVKNGDCRTGNFRDVYNRLSVPTNIHPYAYLGAYLNESGGVYGVAMRASIMPQ
jgi:hypothetical protein